MTWYLAATLIGANLLVAIHRPHRWVFPLLVKRRDLEDWELERPVLRGLALMETECRVRRRGDEAGYLTGGAAAGVAVITAGSVVWAFFTLASLVML